MDFLLESLVSFLDHPNTTRFVSPFLKLESNPYFKNHLSLFSSLAQALIDRMGSDVEALSKDNIDKLVAKSRNLSRLLYKMSKAQVSGTVDEQKILALLSMVDKKEQMAKNVLTSEILNKFRELKEVLVQSLVLSLNIKKSDSMNQVLEVCLRNVELSMKTRVTVLNPETKFPKVKFDAYYE